MALTHVGDGRAVAVQHLLSSTASRWSSARIEEALAVSLLPLLLVSVALNQPRPVPGLGAIGQMASIGGIGVAMGLVALALPNRVWPIALAGMLVAARGLRLLLDEPDWLVLAYTVLGAALFSAAGAVIVTVRPQLLRRQFAILCAVSLPIMLAQILGFEWSQVLRTDIETGASTASYTTLFVPAGQIVQNTLQARPAGLMYANNVFSIIVLFGLGLHFGRVEGRHLSWRDVAILSVVVLLMAKITLLGICVMLALRMFWGSDARAHSLRCVAVLVASLTLYRIAFPGPFAVNLGPDVWLINFQTRVADLLLATRVPALAAIAERFPAVILTKLSVSGATQSGYAQLVESGRPLIPAVVVSLPYFWMVGRILFQFDRVIRREIVAVGTMMCLAPLITPYFSSLLFWFLAGGALRPIWRLLNSGLPPAPAGQPQVRFT